MSEPDVLTENRDGVLIVTLNRPASMNALSNAMVEGFTSALEAADSDDAVRAVVLTGAGDRAFSAGQDLEEAQSFTAETIGDHFRRLGRLYQSVRALGKPSVVALNGVAVGFGFQCALHADVRIGHPKVRLSQPEVAAGIPSVMGLFIIKETVGLARAVELSLTCRMVGADEAKVWGILDEIVEPDRVLPRAIEVANDLAAKPPIAFRASKANLLRLTQDEYDATIEAAARIQAEAFGTGEPARVMEAFLAKRRRA